MANRSTKKSLERFKYEVADELGITEASVKKVREGHKKKS